MTGTFENQHGPLDLVQEVEGEDKTMNVETDFRFKSTNSGQGKEITIMSQP